MGCGRRSTALVWLGLFLWGCGGTLTEGGGAGGGEGSGGAPGKGTGGGSASTGGGAGTGGAEGGGGRYVEPVCPDVEPPPVEVECDPMAPLDACPEGFGCYPYLDYPFGAGCGHARYGAACSPVSSGVQGELCGDELGYCAPGHLCVLGAAGGKRCGRLCSLVAPSGCADGLICGETDVKGYGVCY